jgi:CheY-like chemotaxis protein
MARILHVENEARWREIIRQILGNHLVDSASSYEEALELLNGGAPYQLALVDLNLVSNRDQLGGQILDFLLLEERHKDTRRVVITGSPPPGPVRASLFDRYVLEEIIIKDELTAPDLRRVVETALARLKDEIPLNVKLMKSELLQRFREWRNTVRTDLRTQVRFAEEFAYNAARVHGSSLARAEAELEAAESRLEEFAREALTFESRFDKVENEADIDAANSALGELETRFRPAERNDYPT